MLQLGVHGRLRDKEPFQRFLRFGLGGGEKPLKRFPETERGV